MSDVNRIIEWVTCPYFREAQPYVKKIRCEGPEEGSFLMLEFTGRKRLETHIENYCSAYPAGCPISDMLDRGNGV